MTSSEGKTHSLRGPRVVKRWAGPAGARRAVGSPAGREALGSGEGGSQAVGESSSPGRLSQSSFKTWALVTASSANWLEAPREVRVPEGSSHRRVQAPHCPRSCPPSSPTTPPWGQDALPPPTPSCDPGWPRGPSACPSGKWSVMRTELAPRSTRKQKVRNQGTQSFVPTVGGRLRPAGLRLTL